MNFSFNRHNQGIARTKRTTPPGPDKDSFWTISYKDGHIHGCHNRITGKEELQISLPDGSTRPARTLIGAKRVITNSSQPV